MNENNTPSLSDIAAVTDKNDFGGNGAWWIIILFLFCFMGWNGNRGFGQSAPAPMPNAATSGEVQNGFDHQAVMTGVNSITAGMNQGFADAEVSRCTKAQTIVNGITNAAYASQQQISDSRYQTSAEIADLKSAVGQGFMQVQVNTDQKVQEIKDKLCEMENERKDERISELQQQLNEANRVASQTQQTGDIISALRTPAPIPAYPVSNPNGCNCGTNFSGCCA